MIEGMILYGSMTLFIGTLLALLFEVAYDIISYWL